MDRFEKDYYGAFLSVEVIGFIRCESDLKYFGNLFRLYFCLIITIYEDHLIKMIHNDVQTAHNLLEIKS